MINFTHNNHLKYSISDREFGYRESSMEKYKLTLGSIDPERFATSNYIEELHRTAGIVSAEFGKDLVVFLSGGTDSEIVLRNFLAIGHRPKCATIRFKNGYNADDVFYATELASKLGVELEYIDFDIKDFLYSGEAAEFGNTIQCSQITYLMVYKSILKLGVPAVMGGEVLLTRKVSLIKSFWYYTIRENEDCSAMRFSNKYNIPLVNEWFSYTPELLLYYLLDTGIQQLVTDYDNRKLTSVSSKNSILTRLYPGLEHRKKTHGFENLLAFNYEAYQSLASGQIKRLESCIDGIPYDIALAQLKGTYENN